MNWTINLFVVIAFVGAFVPVDRCTAGQPYSTASHAIAGGGSHSTGVGVAGEFAVEGTIGQLDASQESNGGVYGLQGGFWAQYVGLQTLGAPPIAIRLDETSVEVGWSAFATRWVLQVNTSDLSPEGWSDITVPPALTGSAHTHRFPATSGRVFFRLRLR